VDGELTSKDATLTTLLPPDFRRQHITDEVFVSDSSATGCGGASDVRRRQVACGDGQT